MGYNVSFVSIIIKIVIVIIIDNYHHCKTNRLTVARNVTLELNPD